MRSKRPLRAAFVVTFGASALAGTAGGCGGSTSEVADSGADVANPCNGGCNPPGYVCPTLPPTSGSACTVNGATCNYGSSCAPTTYDCTNGTWTATHGNPPAAVCPAAPPTGACPCFPQNFMCTYNAGMCNGSPTQEVAVCENGMWLTEVGSCNPPAPMPDSGPDAQPDASVPDATQPD